MAEMQHTYEPWARPMKVSVKRPLLLHWKPWNATPQSLTPDEVRDARLENAQLASPRRAYKGQQNTPGLYFSGTTGQLALYDSYLEKRVMTMLDFDKDVVAMSTQPCTVQAVVHRRDGPPAVWTHTPDVFVRRADGSGLLIDVVLPKREEMSLKVRRKRALSTEVCRRLRLAYAVRYPPAPVAWVNVQFLSALRRPVFAPPGLVVELLERARDPIAVGSLIAAAGGSGAVRPVVWALCWRRLLDLDVSVPLEDSSLVVASVDPSGLSASEVERLMLGGSAWMLGNRS